MHAHLERQSHSGCRLHCWLHGRLHCRHNYRLHCRPNCRRRCCRSRWPRRVNGSCDLAQLTVFAKFASRRDGRSEDPLRAVVRFRYECHDVAPVVWPHAQDLGCGPRHGHRRERRERVHGAPRAGSLHQWRDACHARWKTGARLAHDGTLALAWRYTAWAKMATDHQTHGPKHQKLMELERMSPLNLFTCPSPASAAGPEITAVSKHQCRLIPRRAAVFQRVM